MIGILAIGLFLFSEVQKTVAGYVRSEQQTGLAEFRSYDFFASSTVALSSSAPTTLATTTSATSTNINSWIDNNGRVDNGYFVIAGAEKVEFFFTRGGETGPNTGTSTFFVQVSPDGTNWYSFSHLLQATSTTEQDRVLIPALDYGTGLFATTTLRFGMNLDYIAPYAVRCIVVEGTDGNHTCKAIAQW